jgi:ubiquinone biosynthesis protein COQ9
MTDATQPPPEDDALEPVRAAILDAALPEVPFDGWTIRTLRAAADAAGVDRDTQRRAFPYGVPDLVAYYSRRMDAEAAERIAALNLQEMRIRDRIKAAVLARLEVLEPSKSAARRAVGFLALPFHAPLGARLVAESADRIWTAIGDTSTDFNFYTKRGILAGVLSATLLVWLEDEGDGSERTQAFLDNRIEDVMRFEKAKAGALSALDRLPSPLSFLAGLRYRGPRYDV